jgi:hypothetical protein
LMSIRRYVLTNDVETMEHNPSRENARLLICTNSCDSDSGILECQGSYSPRPGFGRTGASAPPEFRIERVVIWALPFCLSFPEVASHPLHSRPTSERLPSE